MELATEYESKKVLRYYCSYHLAEKKIPSIHGHTMGYKLEQFIFDAFPYTPSTALFEVIVVLYLLRYFKSTISKKKILPVYADLFNART